MKAFVPEPILAVEEATGLYTSERVESSMINWHSYTICRIYTISYLLHCFVRHSSHPAASCSNRIPLLLQVSSRMSLTRNISVLSLCGFIYVDVSGYIW
jgi:hypothetical protein